MVQQHQWCLSLPIIGDDIPIGLRSFHTRIDKEKCFTLTIFKCPEQINGKQVLRYLQARRFDNFLWMIWDEGDKQKHDGGLVAKTSSELVWLEVH